MKKTTIYTSIKLTVEKGKEIQACLRKDSVTLNELADVIGASLTDTIQILQGRLEASFEDVCEMTKLFQFHENLNKLIPDIAECINSALTEKTRKIWNEIFSSNKLIAPIG